MASTVRRVAIGVAALGVLTTAAPALAAPSGAEDRFATVPADSRVPGEVVVTFSGRPTAADGSAIARTVPGATVAVRIAPRVAVVELPPGIAVDVAVARLRRGPAVAWAEPNWLRTLSVIPDDPDLSWGIRKAHVPQAWDESSGAPGTVIAVIDSGIDLDHPDLDANLWTNPGEIAGNDVDDDGNGRVDDVHGWDFVQDDAVPQDPVANGHGTHVAGIAAAEWNNAEGGAGVCPGCSLMILRAADTQGRLASGDVIPAIRYATDQGADVINLSFGGSQWSRSERRALGDAIDGGSIVVAAAGNGSRDNDSLAYTRRFVFGPSYPASYDLAGLVSVAASTNADRYAPFTNTGHAAVDLAAPGSGIRSTLPDDDYGAANGTSMSSPFVAGLAGLLRTEHATWSPAETANAILNGADRAGPLRDRTRTGGRVDAAASMTAPDTSDAMPSHDGVMSGARSIGSRARGTVATPDDVNDIYERFLRRGRTYEVRLDVPNRRDFDLFVWEPGAQDTFPSDYGCRSLSCRLAGAGIEGKGEDERVRFRVRASGVFRFHVHAYRGRGTYSLRVSAG